MVIQCKNSISLYILPDQRRVNLLVHYKIDRNKVWQENNFHLQNVQDKIFSILIENPIGFVLKFC